MALYQRKVIASGELIDEPAPLPEDLQGGSLTDAELEQLTDLNPAPHYAGQGFFRVPDPEPEPPPPVRWIHKALFKRRFTSEERMAIRSAETDGAVPEQARRLLVDLREILDATDQVFLDDLDLIAGLDLLVSLGLIGALRPPQIRA